MWFRFRKTAALVICPICLITVNAARAGGGGPGLGATELTQQENNFELGLIATRALKQYEEIKRQVDMFQKQFTMLEGAGLESIFRNVGDVIKTYRDFKEIIDKEQGLIYNVANVGEELKRRFKSAGDFKNYTQAEDFVREVRGIGETQMDTTRKMMESIGVAMNKTYTDAQALSEILKTAQAADTEAKISQAANGILGSVANSMIDLRMATASLVQLSGMAMEAERAKEAAAQAEHELLFKPVELNKNVDTSEAVKRLHSDW